MRRRLLFLLFILSAGIAAAFPVYYKEQYYKLYHTHYIQYPDDSIENIYYLEQATKADFCNPLYALAKIDTKQQWAKYRALLDMHLRLKLIEQHLILGSKYDKQIAYFYNAPWKEQNLESLKTAETCYQTALLYWEDAKKYALEARKYRFIDLAEFHYEQDESLRIETGKLDYADIINDELKRLEKVRADFQAMSDDGTY
jgi:hypothetical protein